MSLREALLQALALKDVARAGWVRVGVAHPESVAAHSWGVAWLVLVLCPPGLDRGRALAIAVVHDLAEATVGDLTPADGVSPEAKHLLERQALEALSGALPDPSDVVALWEEYEHGTTAEGRFVKACDKLDMALQAARYAHLAPTAELVDSALARLPPGLLRDLASG